MNEIDFIYQYTMLQMKAEGIGYQIGTTRDEFVMRHARTNQLFARRSTLEEMGQQVANAVLIQNLKNVYTKGAKP